MFGAKIKKWIEIVNPRKKSSKNKNANSTLPTQQYSTSDYKGTVYQNEATIVSSPARRSEVSPIQINNGRRGWHSPNQENPSTTSNKLDCPPPVIKSQASNGKHHVTVSNVHSPSTTNNSNKINNYLTTAPTTFYQMKELDQSMMQQSNQSLKPQIIVSNNNSANYNNTLHTPSHSYSTPTSSSNELLDRGLVSSSASSVNSTIAKIQKTDVNKINNNYTQQQHTEESKYGKIQPIANHFNKYRFFSSKISSIDRYNGNSSDDFCYKTLDNTKTSSPKMQPNAQGSKTCRKPIATANGTATNLIKRNNEINNRNMTANATHHYPLSNKIYQNGSSCNEYDGSLLSTFKPPNGNHLTPNAQHSGQNKLNYHAINHVSSPESAYSTGYSTDGNSPGGCSNPDSYYINIRTGIHYFPRGFNSNESITNNNRFKTDLNCIEEKNDEHQVYHSHKRTESLDIGRNASVIASSGIQNINSCQSPTLRRQMIMSTSQFRTPSPRQRSRIRTNPWIPSTIEHDTVPQNKPINLRITTPNSNRKDRDSLGSTTSSSGIKSNSDDSNEKERKATDSDSSSTEKPSKTLLSLNEFRKKFGKKETSSQLPISISTTQHDGSDDDATLNEIGKFDESYVYEKENDFLSDSDKTDCVSDLGQEAGDECESTDDLLDRNEGLKANGKSIPSTCGDQKQKKRKKVLRKRIKNVDALTKSPLASRGCRSVGGTPVLIRRNEKAAERRQLETSLLTNRSNSLTFSEVHMIHNRMLAISESEKALIKADLEADVKYRQLIHEAESILISMKSNLSVPKEPATTSALSSPRRQNIPTNKRVEMLRNCEVDLKRELAKTSNKPQENSLHVTNKRLEILRCETSSLSAPSSPRSNRVVPIKTHVTNFIYQNEMDIGAVRVKQKMPQNLSPTPINRRFLTPKNDVDTDSESDGRPYLKSINDNENQAEKRNPQIQFRSIVCNNDDLFFPQSEPLKRKIYSRNSPIEQVQRTLRENLESDSQKQAMLHKIQVLRNERQQKMKEISRESFGDAISSDAVSCDSPKRVIDDSIKRKLIMKTIEDIKRSLEDQSLELNELHDSDT